MHLTMFRDDGTGTEPTGIRTINWTSTLLKQESRRETRDKRRNKDELAMQDKERCTYKVVTVGKTALNVRMLLLKKDLPSQRQLATTISCSSRTLLQLRVKDSKGKRGVWHLQIVYRVQLYAAVDSFDKVGGQIPKVRSRQQPSR